MRHRVAHRKLGRVTEHRIAMLRNQSVALLRYGSIETTVARAKELRPFVERIITVAKRSLTAPEGSNHHVIARRTVARDIADRDVVSLLFSEIAPRYADRNGGYTRLLRLGYRRGEELGATYAAADLFVFPSKTDTFGIVVIEALASGLPVAAYPATGPVDIVTDERLGALDADLGRAVERALQTGDPAACAAAGRAYTWENCTRQFLDNLVPVARRGS